MGRIIHSIRDYYIAPLAPALAFRTHLTFRTLNSRTQLVYQTTVFLWRSSITLGLPPLPGRLLSLLAIVQGVILTTLAFESAVGIFGFDHEGASFAFMFLLIRVEGICGGLT